MGKQIGFAAVCKQFFGFPTAGDAMREVRALTYDDKAELRLCLMAEGFDIKPLDNSPETAS